MAAAARDVMIDCDPGIDDAVAIMVALRSGAFNVRAITCATGNLAADRSAQNACRVLDLVGYSSIPVAVGAHGPLVRAHAVDPFSHGADGLGDIGFPLSERPPDQRFGPDLLIETARAHPGIVLLATAPLTNVALALIKAPDLCQLVSQVVFIGGNFGFHECSQLHGTGATPLSEWNVMVDPEAARLVFGSGLSLTALGVDLWSRDEVNLTDTEVEAVNRSGCPEAEALAGFVKFVERRGYGRYCAYIDALAALFLLDETLIDTREVLVDVETVSPLTLGMTVVDRRVHHAWEQLPRIRAAYDADFVSLRRGIIDILVN